MARFTENVDFPTPPLPLAIATIFFASILNLFSSEIFVLLLFFLISSNAIAGCEDPINDGVDYTNCRFSDGQDLQGSYLPNSKLSFTSFIQVNFDKSIMMSSNLSFGTFPESSFVRANLYESILVGANFEKANFTGANSVSYTHLTLPTRLLV